MRSLHNGDGPESKVLRRWWLENHRFTSSCGGRTAEDEVNDVSACFPGAGAASEEEGDGSRTPPRCRDDADSGTELTSSTETASRGGPQAQAAAFLSPPHLAAHHPSNPPQLQTAQHSAPTVPTEEPPPNRRGRADAPPSPEHEPRVVGRSRRCRVIKANGVYKVVRLGADGDAGEITYEKDDLEKEIDAEKQLFQEWSRRLECLGDSGELNFVSRPIRLNLGAAYENYRTGSCSPRSAREPSTSSCHGSLLRSPRPVNVLADLFQAREARSTVEGTVQFRDGHSIQVTAPVGRTNGTNAEEELYVEQDYPRPGLLQSSGDDGAPAFTRQGTSLDHFLPQSAPVFSRQDTLLVPQGPRFFQQQPTLLLDGVDKGPSVHANVLGAVDTESVPSTVNIFSPLPPSVRNGASQLPNNELDLSRATLELPDDPFDGTAELLPSSSSALAARPSASAAADDIPVFSNIDTDLLRHLQTPRLVSRHSWWSHHQRKVLESFKRDWQYNRRQILVHY